MHFWYFFGITVFLFGVVMNFKPLLKTLTSVSVRHAVDKFISFGERLSVAVKQKIIFFFTM